MTENITDVGNTVLKTNLLERNVTENVLKVISEFTLRKDVGQKQPPEMTCEKIVLKNFANVARKHLCWSFIFKRLSTLKLAILLKYDSCTCTFV